MKKLLKENINLTEEKIYFTLLESFQSKNIDIIIQRDILEFAKAIKKYLLNLTILTKKIETEVFSIEKAKQDLSYFNTKILEKGNKLEKSINNRILSKKIKQSFRSLVGKWAYKSYILKRSYEKPRGYPGDYIIMEFVYNEKVISEGIGYIFDEDFLYNEYAVAVKNRKNKMKEILLNYIQNSNFKKINILNLACGSSRELKELFLNTNFQNKQIIITLIDQDEAALQFSQEALSGLHSNLKFKFLKENIYDFIKDKINIKNYTTKFGCQNLIYTIGLSDYLPDRALGNLIKFFFELLLPDGKLILAHKDISKYTPLAPDWFCDWTFFPRTKNMLIDLTKSFINIKDKNIEFITEDSGIIFFMIL
ncbi:MAG: hypothetical protein HY934_09845, partial [Candidatus Firestonebacteria bacterium]|nr:hypothetical protein [Candidatus Firestonebacteria bacterium]